MLAFILQRLIQAMVVMVTVAFIAFLLFQYVGDPVVFLLGQDATKEQIDLLRADLGLDQPFFVQFGHFLVNAVQGEFGLSLRQGAKVSRLIAEAEELVGYGLYIDLLGPLAAGKPRADFPLGGEEDRCRHALERAGEGRNVALVCSGDAGIYAMAALVFELLDRREKGVSAAASRVEVVCSPGISALQAAAARAGAPLGHDFCAISLSDLLTPRADILSILSEPLEIHFPAMTRADREARCAELLRSVQLPAEHLRRHPHEFSGGQRQRIGIARALAVQPELIICDEPVSALDVSVQAEVVNLLQDLQEQFGLTYLFIAHDLAVVEHVSDHILVMSKGKIVEQGTPAQILGDPQEAYTKTLLAAVPRF